MLNSDCLSTPGLSPDPFSDLNAEIEKMKKYGESLKNVDEKGNSVIELADELHSMVDQFKAQADKGTEELNKFKIFFKANLHSRDNIMSEHRAAWKPILANILLALTGIGLVAIAVNAVCAAIDHFKNEKPFTINNALFFARTQREHKIGNIEEAVNSLAMQASV